MTMDYVISADELIDEEIQKQIRLFIAKKDGRFMWYRIQCAIENARKFKLYHMDMEKFVVPNFFEGDSNAMMLYHRCDPEQRQVSMMKKKLAIAKRHKHLRGRVTNYKLRFLLRDIEARRADRYLNPEKYMKKKILCIVGQSGVGKTLASLHLQNHKGANVICSFTTRPPRSTEVEGREHHFVDIVPDRTELLAYTHFGEYYYYALKDQVFGPCTVYVIDEKGLVNMRKDNGNDYDIYSLYIKRETRLRTRCGVTRSRMNRDMRRELLDESEYDYVIENNGSKVAFFDQLEAIYDEVCNLPERI